MIIIIGYLHISFHINNILRLVTENDKQKLIFRKSTILIKTCANHEVSNLVSSSKYLIFSDTSAYYLKYIFISDLEREKYYIHRKHIKCKSYLCNILIFYIKQYVLSQIF